MTVTLDTLTIKPSEGFEEAHHIVAVEWDDWDGDTNAYTKRMKVIGSYRTWSLVCTEKVPWSSSAAKQFSEKQAAGTIVNFEVTEDPLHTVTPAVSVYIRDVSIRYESGLDKATQLRTFAVDLLETV